VPWVIIYIIMNLSVHELRKKHSRFIYHSYQFDIEKEIIRFSFHFEIEPNISFFPQVNIEGINSERIKTLGPVVLNNLAFQMGLMEIPSYWKAACSPEILVKAGFLDRYQLVWWKDLLIRGLGEFFYINSIDFTSRDFVIIKAEKEMKKRNNLYAGKLNSGRYLVPIGGGKDSSVTSELLKNANKIITPFCLNPTEASLQIIKFNGFKSPIIAERKIDNKLLALNKKGYLNGHTPFSAYLAFLSSVVAVLFDNKTILVSNGKSANEENVIFNEEEINHQYSKSFRFEQKFRDYAKKYLATDLEFISFLRPLYELQIAKIFSGLPDYFSIFKSCNKGQKTNTWCHKCAKCLFVYTVLYPFADKKILTSQIFSEDLFEKKELIPMVQKFLEFNSVKPFDCIGTREETIVAFYLCLEKAKKNEGRLPLLLRMIEDIKMIKLSDKEKSKKEILKSWDEQNFLTEDLEAILRHSER